MDKTQFASVGEQVGAQTPEQYFASIKQEMETPEPRGRELTVEEDRKMQDGFALEEMTHSAGWAVINDILTGMAFHSWVDPRTIEGAAGRSSQEEWMWRELNAFHMANTAKELLETVQTIISEAHGLQAIKLGEVKGVQRMKV